MLPSFIKKNFSKFYKNNQVLQNVSGNIWQGQADWHKGNLRGSVSWRTRPWDLLLLRVGANVEVIQDENTLMVMSQNDELLVVKDGHFTAAPLVE